MTRGIDVDGSMAELVAKELFQLDGGHWSFRSDLVREVAYNTLTKGDRAKLHAGIASLDREAPRGRVVRRRGRPAGPPLRRGGRAGRRPRRRLGRARRPLREGGPLDLRGGRPGPPGRAARRGRAARHPGAGAGRSRSVDPAARAAAVPRRGAGRRVGPRPAPQVDAEQARRDAEALGETVPRRQGAPRAGRRRPEVGPGRGGGAAPWPRRPRPSPPSATTAAAARRCASRAWPRCSAASTRRPTTRSRAALEAFRQVGFGERRGLGAPEPGVDRVHQGRTDEAERRLDVAVATFRELGDGVGIAWAQGLLAFVKFQQGDREAAEQLGHRDPRRGAGPGRPLGHRDDARARGRAAPVGGPDRRGRGRGRRGRRDLRPPRRRLRAQPVGRRPRPGAHDGRPGRRGHRRLRGRDRARPTPGPTPRPTSSPAARSAVGARAAGRPRRRLRHRRDGRRARARPSPGLGDSERLVAYALASLQQGRVADAAAALAEHGGAGRRGQRATAAHAVRPGAGGGRHRARSSDAVALAERVPLHPAATYLDAGHRRARRRPRPRP